MSKIAKKLTDLIGDTPLLELGTYRDENNLEANLIAKVEYFNPLGSVKDRVANAMIETAIKEGKINKDTVIIEPTSGNTGIGLAFVTATKGLHLILTMPETMSIERRRIVAALGAEVVLTPGVEGMKGAIAKAEALKEEYGNAFIPQQFENEANPKIHFETTGPEIWRDTDGKVDIFVAGVGTGGTVTGIGKYIKSQNPNAKIVAVEPASCPSLTRGKYAYDFCDTGKITPMAKMYTLGCEFTPSKNHAGGLRYHGMSPILSKLYHDGYMEAISVEQTKVFEAATLFAKVETILPAPESSHAIRVAIDEALKCKETGEEKTILFGLTGTGYFDMKGYNAYIEGTMTDYIPTDEDLQVGFDKLPIIPGIQDEIK
ncbi:MAG: pyridoxal-phosphate dependent enzyme [Intestinibacter bartlettii]|nr:pyridoxal-phosphate dependent enzyme [Intestinibacter bartlettii]